jgi:peptidyl-prolyl cis-trans isomerase SurA
MNLNRLIFLLSGVILLSSCSSQGRINQLNDPAVGVVNGETILFSEVYNQFYKSSIRAESEADDSSETKEIIEFLPLYVDYKAKLASARDGGYFTDSEILAELEQYESQTAYPYWLENKIKSQLLDEMFDRSKEELNASHILINLPSNATPADTLTAWNTLLDARNKALNGENFDSLSVVYSSNQQGRSMGGDLGYFSAGWAIKDFEDVAYSLQVDDISMPFRTQFGYHIIKMKERRPTSPDRHLSHVFFRVPGDDQIDDVLEAANVAYQEYVSGTIDWSNMVENYTQDAQSGPLDGRIGWVNHGRYDPRFTDVVMSIADEGAITEPFYSGYGVHIVRLDSIKKPDSEEKVRADLMTRLQNLPRYRENRQVTLKNIRNAGNEYTNITAINAFEEAIKKNPGVPYSSVEWNDELLNQNMYRINNEWYKISDYLDWLVNNSDGTVTNNYHFSNRDLFYSSVAEKHVIPITKEVFPAFAQLSTEYLNGLVIFKISEDSVWNYSKMDTTTIRAMYDSNPESYRYDDRYFIKRLSSSSDSTLQVARGLLQAGVHVDSLRNMVTGVVVREDVINDLSQDPYQNLTDLTVGGLSEIFQFRNRPTLLYLDRMEPSRTMTFDEAYFRIVSEYQPIREENWLNSIRAKYNVRMYPERITEELYRTHSNNR